MQEELNEFIERALHEDVKDGDHTSLACIPDDAIGKAHLLVKENGILAGMDLAALIFQKVDERIVMNPVLKDGDAIAIDDIAFTIEGPSSSLLTAERLVLNCMQRMSGIATKTHEINKLIEVLDKLN